MKYSCSRNTALCRAVSSDKCSRRSKTVTPLPWEVKTSPNCLEKMIWWKTESTTCFSVKTHREGGSCPRFLSILRWPHQRVGKVLVWLYSEELKHSHLVEFGGLYITAMGRASFHRGPHKPCAVLRQLLCPQDRCSPPRSWTLSATSSHQDRQPTLLQLSGMWTSVKLLTGAVVYKVGAFAMLRHVV